MGESSRHADLLSPLLMPFQTAAFLRQSSKAVRRRPNRQASAVLSLSLLDCRPQACSAGFLVNTTAFGAAQNRIGISEGNFSTCLGSYPTGGDGCSSAPYGVCTAVNSGGPYDQFSHFRSQLWGSYIPLDNTWSCSFFGNGRLQPDSSAFGTQYT